MFTLKTNKSNQEISVSFLMSSCHAFMTNPEF